MPQPADAARKRAEIGNIDSGADGLAAAIRQHLRQTYGPNVVENPAGRAGLLALRPDSLFAKDRTRTLLVGAARGLGAKLRIAFMMNRHGTVGVDLVALNVNDLACVGAEPLFFLACISGGTLEPAATAEVVKGIAAGCRESGCSLLGSDTAEVPGLCPPGQYALAGAAVGVVDRRRRIDGSHILPGDRIIGLASSGLHADGYELVRSVFFDRAMWKANRYVDELGCTLGEELLRPTLAYSIAVRSVLRVYRVKHMVRGIAHIAGGGFAACIPPVLPPGCGARIVRGTWPVPPIFTLVQKLGNIGGREEMHRAFNMGIGMILVVSPLVAEIVIRRLEGQGRPAWLIGEIVKGDRNVTIT